MFLNLFVFLVDEKVELEVSFLEVGKLLMEEVVGAGVDGGVYELAGAEILDAGFEQGAQEAARVFLCILAKTGFSCWDTCPVEIFGGCALFDKRVVDRIV